MLDQIRAFLGGLRGDESSTPDSSNPDVAAVALFFHVIGADGVVDEVESEKLKTLIVDATIRLDEMQSLHEALSAKIVRERELSAMDWQLYAESYLDRARVQGVTLL